VLHVNREFLMIPVYSFW